MTRTCDKCGHTAPVEEFRQQRIRIDGVLVTTYLCPRCGAIRRERK